MTKLSKTAQRFFIVCFLAAAGCSWVDDTGRQENTSPDISLDDVNRLEENSQFEWPIRDFDDDGNIASLSFELVGSGEVVSSCAAQFPPAVLAPTLRAACQPLLSDGDCLVNFDINSDRVQVSLPELQRPAALRYEIEVIDEDGAVDSRTIDLCIASVSETPIAMDDSYSVVYLGDLEHSGSDFDEQCVSQGGTGVLENDQDDFDFSEGWSSGQACLRAELVEGPTYAASFDLRADGGFSYKSSGAAGPGSNDSFKYSVSDGRNRSEVAVVSISITGDNDAPSALNPSLATTEDVAILIEVSQLADDPENTDLKIESFSQPENGVVELVDGGLRFTPAANFFGEASFKAVVADSSGLSVESVVVISIDQVNDAPVASDLPNSFVLDVEGSAQPGEFHWSFTVSDEETPAQLLQLSFRGDTSVVSSRIVGPSPTGEVDLYLTPLNDGSVTFELELRDQPVDGLEAQSQTYEIPLIVTGLNQAPLAEDDEGELFKNEEITLDVLINDSDPDGDDSALRLSAVVSQPNNGTALIADDGRQINYIPDTGFSGIDSLTYDVVDERGASARAVFTLTVVNRAPVVQNESRTLLNISTALVAVLDNDFDPDGDSLSVELSEGNYSGVAQVIDNAIIYDPDSSFVGTAIVPYEVLDGDGGVASGQVAFVVNEISGGR